jgi:hypothetical protein
MKTPQNSKTDTRKAILEMGLLIVVQHLLKSISHFNWKLLEMAMHQMNKKKDKYSCWKDWTRRIWKSQKSEMERRNEGHEGD